MLYLYRFLAKTEILCYNPKLKHALLERKTNFSLKYSSFFSLLWQAVVEKSSNFASVIGFGSIRLSLHKIDIIQSLDELQYS